MKLASTHQEPLSQVLDEAEARGFALPSADQLERWRREGILPRWIERHGLGRGRGVEYIYPAGTGAWLADLLRFRKCDRRTDSIAWNLWVAGYPLTGRFRALLVATAKRLANELNWHLNDFEADGNANIISQIDLQKVLPGNAWPVKVVGRGDVTAILRTCMEGFAGRPDVDFEDECVIRATERLMRHTLGLLFRDLVPRSLITGEDFVTIGKSFFDRMNMPAVIRHLQVVPDQELEDLRDEVQALFKEWLPELVEQFRPPPQELLINAYIFRRIGIPLGTLVGGLSLIPNARYAADQIKRTALGGRFSLRSARQKNECT